MGAIPVDGALE